MGKSTPTLIKVSIVGSKQHSELSDSTILMFQSNTADYEYVDLG